MTAFQEAIQEGYVLSSTFDLWSESRRFQTEATGHRKALRQQGFKTRTVRENINGGVVISILKKKA